MKWIVLIGLGGFFGAISRYLLSGWMQHFVPHYPIGTLTVNVLGSFLIGFLALFLQEHADVAYRMVIVTGFLGALTTFSTFSYESVTLLQSGAYIKALSSILLNLTLTLTATTLGILLYKRLFV